MTASYKDYSRRPGDAAAASQRELHHACIGCSTHPPAMVKKRGAKDAARVARSQPSNFESAPIARKRHAVVGHREKGRAHSSLQARSRADELRRQTLQIEHEQQGRTNVVSDARFGAIAVRRARPARATRVPRRQRATPGHVQVGGQQPTSTGHRSGDVRAERPNRVWGRKLRRCVRVCGV